MPETPRKIFFQLHTYDICYIYSLRTAAELFQQLSNATKPRTIANGKEGVGSAWFEPTTLVSAGPSTTGPSGLDVLTRRVDLNVTFVFSIPHGTGVPDCLFRGVSAIRGARPRGNRHLWHGSKDVL